MICLDITPRQSGKTTRMCQYIVDNWKDYENIFICCMNYSIAAWMFEKIKQLTSSSIYNELKKNLVKISWMSNSSLRGANTETDLFCFDEFDWFDDIYGKIIYFKNGYYCSTLKDNVQYNHLMSQLSPELKFMYL